MIETKRADVVVLVPYLGHIHPVCELGLRGLEQLGYRVWRAGGNAAIDAARSQLATDALRDGFQHLMWIDSDIGFEPTDVERLAHHRLPLVAGIYVKKGRRELACELLPETTEVIFGRGGGLLELLFAATGFFWTDRRVYETMADQGGLPVCNLQWNRPLVPFFMPMIDRPPGGPPRYLAEDFVFSQRARGVGFRIWADTSIRLRHFGENGYTWEDAGSSRSEYESYRFEICNSLSQIDGGRHQSP